MLIKGKYYLVSKYWDISTTSVFDEDYGLAILTSDVPDNILSAKMYKVFTKGVKFI